MSDNLSNKNNKSEQINSTKKYSVYRHIAPNSKCYVGISSNIKRRWEDNGHNYSTQVKFYRAIKKYGWDNFIHEIILTNLSLEEAYKWEKYYILKYNSVINGYNADYGGAGSAGHAVSAAARKKMGTKPAGWVSPLKGKSTPMIEVYVYDINGNCIFKEAGYKKIAELLKTKRSTIINACNSHYLFANKYIILNSKNLDTLPEMLIFAKKYIENLKKPTIFQYSLDGKFIASYTTYKEAAKATGFNIGNIGQSCSGIALRVNKYFFLKTTDAAAIQERVNRIRASSYCIVKKDIVNLNLIIEDKKKEK